MFCQLCLVLRKWLAQAEVVGVLREFQTMLPIFPVPLMECVLHRMQMVVGVQHCGVGGLSTEVKGSIACVLKIQSRSYVQLLKNA